MNKKRIFLTIFFTILLILLLNTKSKAGQQLNDLEFDVNINSDGSMKVTEIWDIYISNTNTLFKTFKKDNSKYSKIDNVTVTDITEENYKQLSQTNQQMYHVTKDYYYALTNDQGLFEIAWGVGLDDSSDERKYKIEYTVEDAIAKYNDCAELYWQFIGEDFAINANKIKGTITLPQKVESKDNIKVWGHIETLNGTIYATDNDKIEFNVDGYNSNNYLEIRIAVPTEIISYSGRTYNVNKLQNIVDEETKWANEANLKRNIKNIVIAIVIIFFIIKTIKYIKMIKNNNKFKPSQELQYYRELPYENATPAEAVYVLEKQFSTFSINNIGNIFSATILDLNLKGIIQIEAENQEIKILINKEKSEAKLKLNEIEILKFLRKINNKDEITKKELEKYINNHTQEVENLIKKIHSSTENVEEEMQNIDIDNKNIRVKYSGISSIYLIVGFFLIGFSVPIGIILMINALLTYIISTKVNVLTQKGVDEQEKWKGLKKYMQDFSLLKEKEIPALELWEEYLVFATAFGISKKVLEQLKIIYPEIEEINEFNKYSTIYLLTNTNFNTSFTKSINTSFSTAYSSGSGSGGGFSGGGGGRTVVAGGGGGR